MRTRHLAIVAFFFNSPDKYHIDLLIPALAEARDTRNTPPARFVHQINIWGNFLNSAAVHTYHTTVLHQPPPRALPSATDRADNTLRTATLRHPSAGHDGRVKVRLLSQRRGVVCGGHRGHGVKIAYTVLTTRYRQELLAWLNSLLSLNFTKVEQCGTG